MGCRGRVEPAVKVVLVAAAACLGLALPTMANAQPSSPAADPPPGRACPLDRIAMVRGSDSEASEGGGFYAARKNGIHGAVDLNGSLGEPVYAVANGKVIVATQSDWGKLGKTVVIDHREGGYTIYAHLHSVEVTADTSVTAGHLIGTMGYSGNAASLRAKNLPPHLHFAYLRPVRGIGGTPLARIKDSAEGVRINFAKDPILADVAGILNPLQAVGFHTCWEDPSPLPAPTTRSMRTTPR